MKYPNIRKYYDHCSTEKLLQCKFTPVTANAAISCDCIKYFTILLSLASSNFINIYYIMDLGPKQGSTDILI